MILATALPHDRAHCSNASMFQGAELAAAIRSAIERKRARAGHGRYGPTALGAALGMRQSSASELLKTGRLAKAKLPRLFEEFADVVGPEHWGLPPQSRGIWTVALPRHDTGAAPLSDTRASTDAVAQDPGLPTPHDLAMEDAQFALTTIARIQRGLTGMRLAMARAALHQLIDHPELVDDATHEIQRLMTDEIGASKRFGTDG